jgi:hypothetical protein
LAKFRPKNHGFFDLDRRQERMPLYTPEQAHHADFSPRHPELLQLHGWQGEQLVGIQTLSDSLHRRWLGLLSVLTTGEHPLAYLRSNPLQVTGELKNQVEYLAASWMAAHRQDRRKPAPELKRVIRTVHLAGMYTTAHAGIRVSTTGPQAGKSLTQLRSEGVAYIANLEGFGVQYDAGRLAIHAIVSDRDFQPRVLPQQEHSEGSGPSLLFVPRDS